MRWGGGGGFIGGVGSWEFRLKGGREGGMREEVGGGEREREALGHLFLWVRLIA